MTHNHWAIVIAACSALFGVGAALYIWHTTMREDPNDEGTFTPPSRDWKLLLALLVPPSLAAVSAAVSLAAVTGA